jgi:uncharacterized membrane protein
MKNRRIWELDAFRGLCVLGMVIVHFVYDLTDMFALVKWNYPDWFEFVMLWGGVLFLLLSGICVTLGHHPIRRGLIVLGCGIAVSAVTVVLWKYFDFHKSIIIYFGVLHCLGCCMILWPLMKKLPFWALLPIGLALVLLGFYIDGIDAPMDWMVILGFRLRGFWSSDYFPLVQNLGFFLMGAGLGKLLYRSKKSLLPKVNDRFFLLRFLQFCGRHSLWIYMLHQPVLAGFCLLLTML